MSTVRSKSFRPLAALFLLCFVLVSFSFQGGWVVNYIMTTTTTMTKFTSPSTTTTTTTTVNLGRYCHDRDVNAVGVVIDNRGRPMATSRTCTTTTTGNAHDGVTACLHGRTVCLTASTEDSAETVVWVTSTALERGTVHCEPCREEEGATTDTNTTAVNTVVEEKAEMGIIAPADAPPWPTPKNHTIKTQRRSKIIICGKHIGNPRIVFTKEFHLKEVPLMTTEDWDVIYGGYMHCQPKNEDGTTNSNMDAGLNQKLNQQGWNNLRPHHIWFPCMGCHLTYCNKVQLCHLMRAYDPNFCFVLPQDMTRLQARMDGETLFVLKRDALHLHLHVGSGVQYVKTLQGREDELSDGTYIVQPYYPPLLSWRNRKAELKVYLAITSVFPLRFYAHTSTAVILSPVQFKGHNSTDRCQHLTYVDYGDCPIDIPPAEQVLTFPEYAERAGLDGRTFMYQLLRMLYAVVNGAQGTAQSHYVNRGLHESGAGCFSLMRADVGFSQDGQPVLYEINEFPYFGGQFGTKYTEIKMSALRDLLRMIGIDTPPIPWQERAAYEEAHGGGWIHLLDDRTVMEQAASQLCKSS